MKYTTAVAALLASMFFGACKRQQNTNTWIFSKFSMESDALADKSSGRLDYDVTFQGSEDDYWQKIDYDRDGNFDLRTHRHFNWRFRWGYLPKKYPKIDTQIRIDGSWVSIRITHDPPKRGCDDFLGNHYVFRDGSWHLVPTK